MSWHQHGAHIQLFFLIFLVSLSLWADVTLVDLVRQIQEKSPKHQYRVDRPVESYSFIGNDWPGVLPTSKRLVRMAVEESVHYPLIDPESFEEWLWTAPVGDNHIRLGPDKRTFAVAMVHQLHCLRDIRIVMQNGLRHGRQEGHIQHCFNYLRQWILCSADVTLEPGDYMTRNFTIDRAGGTRTCHDWQETYDIVEKNWLDWERFRKAHGLPPFVIG